MNKEKIIKTIKYIKFDISRDNCNIIEKKSHYREFKIFSPNRLKVLSKIIKKVRRRLVSEIAHILEPELDKQQEINLRLLKEIEELKKTNLKKYDK